MRIWAVLPSFRFMTVFVSTALGFQGHSRYSLSDGDFSSIDLALSTQTFLDCRLRRTLRERLSSYADDMR